MLKKSLLQKEMNTFLKKLELDKALLNDININLKLKNMRLRNVDWEDDEKYDELFQPRKQVKIKKMKASSKINKSERTNQITDD